MAAPTRLASKTYKIAQACLPKLTVGIVMVEKIPSKAAAEKLLKLASPHFPLHGVMLVALTENGFQAYAHFQTHTILALLQIEKLTFRDVDLAHPPATNNPPPF